MTLELEIAKMAGKVDEMITRIAKEVETFEIIRSSLPFDFIVSKRLPETDRSSQSIRGILEKIANRRANLNEPSNPQGIDQFSYPAPFTVHVESCNDSLPITITQPNLEFTIRRSVVFRIPRGSSAIVIATRDVMINGGVFAFANKEDGNQAIKAESPGNRNVVRMARLYNATGARLMNIDTQELNEDLEDIRG